MLQGVRSHFTSGDTSKLAERALHRFGRTAKAFAALSSSRFRGSLCQCVSARPMSQCRSPLAPRDCGEKEGFRSPYPHLCHVIAEAEAVLRLLSGLPNVDHLFEWPCQRGLRLPAMEYPTDGAALLMLADRQPHARDGRMRALRPPQDKANPRGAAGPPR